MARRLFLHIGSHKTGTTSIQHFLVSRIEELAKRGYAYPLSENGVNLGGVIGRLDEDQDDRKAALTSRMRHTLQSIRECDAETVIASSEGFSYVNGAEEIATLARRLGKVFDRIKVITYLRRQDQFAVSHHQEGANPQTKPAAKLHGHRPTALPETSALQQLYLDYETRIGHWADAFGDKNVIVRVYDRANLRNGDSVSDFLELVGLGDMTPEKSLTHNVSMGFIKTKLGHILNDMLPDQVVKSAVLKRLPDTGKLLPSRAEAQAFLAPYLEGNRRLNARLKISPPEGLFNDDFSMFPEVAEDHWTEETANAALRACLDVIKELSANKLVFAADEYADAAQALKDTKPDLAQRFLEAAKSLRPGSKKLKAQAESLGMGLPKPAPAAEAEPAKAGRGGRGARKKARAAGQATGRKARAGRKAAAKA